MKILHTYCLNYNIGDYELGIGVKNLLRAYLDVDLIGEANLQGTVFNEYYINEVVNKKFDLLVVGGGGIIHGAHWPNGWFWLIEERLIETIKIPFIVYGAGYNYFEGEGGIPERGKSHLRKTIEHAAFFSVRNDGSLGRFREQMGFEVPEVPDPGFHINLNKSYSCGEKGPFVLVQLANDKPEHRFGADGKKESFVSQMRSVVSQLAKRYKVIFTPHVFDDIALSSEVCGGIPNTEIWDFGRYAFDDCPGAIGYYQDAEFVLAMRGHGQIVPLAFNTPVISLENHPKHSGLMRELGLSQYNVSLKSDSLAADLVGAIERLEANMGSYIESLKAINARLGADSKSAFERIGERLGARGRGQG